MLSRRRLLGAVSHTPIPGERLRVRGEVELMPFSHGSHLFTLGTTPILSSTAVMPPISAAHAIR